MEPCVDSILFGFTQRWIRDDLSGFMPLSNLTPAPDGSLVGLLTMDEIAEFLEKNPDVEDPEWYGALDPEANPVAVIISD